MKNYTNIKNRKIRIAIVGCGRISKNHFKSVKKYKKHIELVAICEIQKSILKKYEKLYSVKGYSNLEKMLQSENLDIVALCTPSGLHPSQAILSAKYKVNVITEKPMATNWKDGKRMVEYCEKADVRLFVVMQNRKNETLQLLKRAITDDRFGKINMVHINVFWYRPQEYYDQASWRGTFKLDGGAFMNQASHYFDLLSWLIGPVDKINSMISKTRKIETEDTGILNIKWLNGTLGSICVTMLTYPRNLEGSITILGDKGTVRIGGLAVNKIQHWEFNDYKQYDQNIKKANYKTTSVYGFGHLFYYQNVIDVIRGKAEPETDGREGLNSLELIIAAYLSAKNDKIISLPLD